MPQDGSNNYQYPPGTPGIPDTTIESEGYNTFLDDLVVNDLNIPRPIHRGGTNATTALQAMINLNGEVAKQVVTNYATQPWVNGSFYSAPGATGAPNPTNRFAGIYYGNADDSYATVEARDQTTGILYVKKKVAGVWDAAWAEQVSNATDLDARYVNVTGDTMTGNLTVGNNTAASQIVINGSGGAFPSGSTLAFNVGGALKYILGNASATLGGAQNDDLLLWSPTGFSSLRVSYATGLVTVSGDPTAALGVATKQYVDNTTVSLAGDTMTGPLTINFTTGVNVLNLNGGGAGQGVFLQLQKSGANTWFFGHHSAILGSGTSNDFIFYSALAGEVLRIEHASRNVTSSNAIAAAGPITAGYNIGTGAYYFGNTGTKYLNYDGTNFNLNGDPFQFVTTGGYGWKMLYPGHLQWGCAISSSTHALVYDDLSNVKQAAYFTAWNSVRSTIGLPNIGSSASAPNLCLISSEMYLATSSLRYKTDIKPLEKADADKILQLEPITYKSKSEVDDPHRTWFGFIAEQVAEIEPRLVIYEYPKEDWIETPEKDKDGNTKSVSRRLREGAVKVPDGLAYDRISVLAVFKAKEQEARITAQEAKIDALMARIDALEAT